MGENELANLVVRLTGEGGSYTRMLEQAGSQTSATVSRIEGALGQLQSTVMQVLGVSTLLGTAFASISKFAERESVEIAFESLIGNAEEAKRSLDDLKRFAAVTPFELPEVLEASKSLLAFGEDASTLVETMRLLGDASAGLGLPLSRLTYLFGTLQSSGRVTMIDLRQFGQAGVPITKQLAYTLGKTTTEIEKMASAGQISVAQVKTAFSATEGPMSKFSGGMEKLSKSLLGLLSTMKDAISETMITIGEDLSKALDLKGVMKKTIPMLEAFGSWIKGIDPAIKATVAKVIMFATAAVGLSFGLKILGFIVGSVVGTLGGLLRVLASVWRVTLTILSPMRLFALVCGVLQTIITAVLSPLGLFVAAVAIVGLALINYFGKAGTIVNWFGRQISRLKEYVKPALDGVANAIKASNIELAFKIVWAQLHLTFIQGIRPLKEAWIGFTHFFTATWIDAASSVQKMWHKAVGEIAKLILKGQQLIDKLLGRDRGDLFEKFRKGFGEAAVDMLTKQRIKELEAARAKLLEALDKSTGDAMKAVTAQIKNLEAELAKLLEKAANEAFDVKIKIDPKSALAVISAMQAAVVGFGPALISSLIGSAVISDALKKAGKGGPDPDALPKETKVEPRDAARARTAEAQFRVQQFLDSGQREDKKEPEKETAKNTKDMVELLKKQLSLPSFILVPAGFSG